MRIENKIIRKRTLMGDSTLIAKNIKHQAIIFDQTLRSKVHGLNPFLLREFCPLLLLVS